MMTMPWFQVTLGGEVLSAEKQRRIKSVKAQKHRTKADTFQIEFHDPEITLVDDPLFTEGTKITLKMGFLNGVRAVWGHGIVKTVQCNFPDDGIPVIALSCQDESILLAKTDKSRDAKDFDGKTDSEIVEMIAKEYGLGTSVENTTKPRDYEKEPVQQSKITDAAFISKLAERNGKKWGVEAGVLWFRQHKVPPDKRCNLQLDYRIGDKSLKNFSPKLRSSGPTGGRQVAAASVDPFKGNTILSRARGAVQNLKEQMGNETAESTAAFEAGKGGTSGDSGTEGKGERPKQVRVRVMDDATSSQDTVLQGGGGAEKSPTDITHQTRGEGTTEGLPDNQEDLDESTKSKQSNIAGVLNAGASLRVPIPDIRAGDWAVIRGVGDRFSGKYEIVQVTFQMGEDTATSMNLDLERKGTGAGTQEGSSTGELGLKEKPQEGGVVADEEDRVFIGEDATSADDTVIIKGKKVPRKRTKPPVTESEGQRSMEAEVAASFERIVGGGN